MIDLSRGDLELIQTSIKNAEYHLGILHGILRPSKAGSLKDNDEDVVIEHLAKLESQIESVREYFQLGL